MHRKNMVEVPKIRHRLVLLFALTGVLVATMSGLSHYLEWLASLCTGFSQGCRETADFSLFHVPLWVWGIAYYVVVSLFFFRARALLFWVIAFGFGVELGLVWIMFSLSIVCLYCLANFVVMLALALSSFEPSRLWQGLTVTLAASILSTLAIPYENSRHTVPALGQKPVTVAKIGDKAITYAELVLPMASRVYDLEQEVYRLERERLEQMLAKAIVEREAEQQGKQPPDFIKDYLATQTISVQEQEVADYYTENRARWSDWKGSEQELMAQIRAYLQQLKTQQRLLEYAKALYPRHGVEIYLKEPQSPSVQVRIEKDDPVMGAENASLTIVEFSDYQCPACRRSHELVRELRQSYADRVRWVFKDFPMPGHQWAKGAAAAARCAAEQGKFWQYQDLLFTSQEELSPPQLVQLAARLNLQMEAFSQCIETGKSQARVDKDIEEGRRFGLDTTPTFIINNRVVTGAPPAARFRQIIDEELEKVRKNS